MKKFLLYSCSIILLTGIIALSLWYGARPYFIQEKDEISPIPDFLMLSKNKEVTLLDLWSPVIQIIHGSEGDAPSLTAQSVLMYDLSTNKILYEKDAGERHAMASLTKIMTAIIALEHQRSDDQYVVASSDIVGEDSMGVSDGEILSFEELLYGLMLPSGNDAAEVFANNYPHGRQSFIQAMNDKAKALGLTNTRFSNPSGLQGDGEQYTTTYDLLVITRYALEHYPLFAKVVATATYDIPETNKHKAFSLVNETNLLTSYPGVKGVKTGYTPEAGLCLITYLDYEGHQIIGIILNSQNRRGEMKELLDYSLKRIDIIPPPFEE
jgi:D-alanyl-D-alanine carboxypeptidase